MSFFSGVQQIGIGVKNAETACAWYKENLGFSIKLFDDVAEAALMTQFTGNIAEKRRAILSLHNHGGGGLEIWQFISRTPTKRPEIKPGTCGILAAIVGTLPTKGIEVDALWDGCLGLRDFDNNLFVAGTACSEGKAGIRGAVIGVSDLKKSEAFYCNVLGFSKTKEEEVVWQGNKATLVSLQLSSKQALFANLLGAMELKLIFCPEVSKSHVFENRYWGDLGFIHLCFETPNMDVFKKACENKEVPFDVDSKDSFGMSAASGRFAYIQDPDGTLIELVETHKIPISKKLGIALDLKKYQNKPIEAWKLKFLKLFN